ncbi:MAG: hypothetical protein WDM92_13065 [Caulobacteraceae bacterium]
MAIPSAAFAAWTYGGTYASSWDEYQAMRAAAHGGTRMTWKTLPDWTGLWTHDSGFNFDPQQQGAEPTAALTPEYKARFDLKIANIKKGIEWDPLSACLPAGYPPLDPRAVPARICAAPRRGVADPGTERRDPPRLHRRPRPCSGRRGLSQLGGRFRRLLGRRHPGDPHQGPQGRPVPAAAAGIFRPGHHG